MNDSTQPGGLPYYIHMLGDEPPHPHSISHVDMIHQAINHQSDLIAQLQASQPKWHEVLSTRLLIGLTAINGITLVGNFTLQLTTGGWN